MSDEQFEKLITVLESIRDNLGTGAVAICVVILMHCAGTSV